MRCARYCLQNSNIIWVIKVSGAWETMKRLCSGITYSIHVDCFLKAGDVTPEARARAFEMKCLRRMQ